MMKQHYLYKWVKKKFCITACLWMVVFLFGSHKIYAQSDIAGEMDVTVKTVNKAGNTESASLFTDADFKLYPNPASDIVYIKSEVKLKEGVVLTLYNIMGNILEIRVLSSGTSKKDYSFDLSKYANGQYIIGIRSSDGSVTKKFIKRG